MVKAYVKKNGKTSYSGKSSAVKWTVPSNTLSPEEIFAMCSPSVVTVYAYDVNGYSQGSGFYIDNYTLVTNYHVIQDATTGIYVCLGDEELYEVTKVLGYDEELDIAILKTKYKGKPLKQNTHGVTVGEKVYAIGNPVGLTNTFSDGMVSCASRKDGAQDNIQVNVDITHGSSGGALVNSYGEVMGITSSGYDGTLLNFAINISQLSSVDTSNPISTAKFMKRFSAWDYLKKFIINHYNTYNAGLGYCICQVSVVEDEIQSYIISYEPEQDEFAFVSVGAYMEVVFSVSEDKRFFASSVSTESMFGEKLAYLDAYFYSDKYTGSTDDFEIDYYSGEIESESYEIDLHNLNVMIVNQLYWLDDILYNYSNISIADLGFTALQ